MYGVREAGSAATGDPEGVAFPFEGRRHSGHCRRHQRHLEDRRCRLQTSPRRLEAAQDQEGYCQPYPPKVRRSSSKLEDRAGKPEAEGAESPVWGKRPIQGPVRGAGEAPFHAPRSPHERRWEAAFCKKYSQGMLRLEIIDSRLVSLFHLIRPLLSYH